MQRRKFISYALASACNYGLARAASVAVPSDKASGGGGDIPVWAPASGEIRNISHAPRRHPLGAGAVLSEIDPKYQAWNPEAPRQGPYKATEYYWGSVLGYCGVCHNPDTRQLVIYGAGHASINVCAPFAFDLNDLRWKWLDVPLPFDGYRQILVNRHNAPPSEATVRLYYPEEQLDYDWGELKGDWAGWPPGFGRPGVIQPLPSHVRSGLVHIPASVAGNKRGLMLNTTVPTAVLSGVHSTASHTFDFDTARWSRNNNRVTSVRFGSAVCNRATGRVYCYTPRSGIYIFDPATRLWRLRAMVSAPQTAVDHGGNVIHEKAGLLIVPCARNARGAPAYYDGVTFTFYACSSSDIEGSGPLLLSELDVRMDGAWPLRPKGNNTSIGWSYCPVDASLYAVNGVGGSSSYWKITPPAGAMNPRDYLAGTWMLSEHSFVRGTLDSSSRLSWVYNRLAWDTPSRSFIWFSDSLNAPVQAFRPAGL